MDDVERDVTTDRISEAFARRIHRPNPAEVRSWRNSMQHMYKVLTEDIPPACSVAIESGRAVHLEPHRHAALMPFSSPSDMPFGYALR